MEGTELDLSVPLSSKIGIFFIVLQFVNSASYIFLDIAEGLNEEQRIWDQTELGVNVHPIIYQKAVCTLGKFFTSLICLICRGRK